MVVAVAQAGVLRVARPRQSHCKRGHELTPDNVVWTRKGRSCRTCRNASLKILYSTNEEYRQKILQRATAYREKNGSWRARLRRKAAEADGCAITCDAGQIAVSDTKAKINRVQT